MNEVKTRWRYVNYFVVGIAVEASRLISFWLFAKTVSPELANVLSLPINILVSFLLFDQITWRDRPGSWIGKLVRFTLGKLFTTGLVKGAVFPFWRAVPVLACPFYDITQWIVDFFPVINGALHSLFTCDWMSVATMDFALAATLGFVINNWFSFWKRKKPSQ